MGREQEMNGNEAESLVFDNLGIDPKEFGGDNGEGDDETPAEGGDAEGDEDEPDAGDDTPSEDDGEEEELDDLSAEPRATKRGEERRDQRRQQPQLGELVLDSKRNVVRQGTKIDQKGNVVDAKTGAIIARVGNERQFYNQANRAEYAAQQFRGRAEKYERDLRKAIEIGREAAQRLVDFTKQRTTGDQLGLTAAEQVEAAQLAAAYKQNPVEMLKTMLTRAAANGIDLTALGIKGGLDVKSIVAAVREEVAKAAQPLSEDAERRRQEQEQAAQRESVAREVEDFFEANPEAKAYMHVFQTALSDERTRHLSLSELWLNIQLAELRRGDGSRRQERGQDPNKRSLPNGRSRPVGGGTRDRNGVADPHMSYDAILRDVLDDQGYTNERNRV